MATLGIGALMPGLAGAGAGLGLLGGAGALAFGGISKTLSAARQASLNVGITPQQMAATSYSNSVQAGQAQQSVTQAREQAAQNAVTAANSIEQADMNLASVARNTAASQIQAYQSVQQAKQGVEQATYSLSEAEYNYSQAVVQAREQITQLNDQLADSKLSVESASLAVQQAEYQEKLVNQSAYSTSIQRQQAALAVAQAKQQVKDATDQESNAQYAANLANKQGVNGSQTVIQAKQGVTAAQYAMTNAANSYADAQRNLTNTELNNAQQVKQAQMQVAQAQEQAAYQQKMDAQSVANAEQNLTQTIREQQLQWAATQSTANQAANQFAKDMGKLTPAGRGFVNEILGMKGAWTSLEATAQNTMLPGLTTWLNGVKTLLPDISSGIGRMGSVIGGTFAQFGKTLATPGAAKVLDGLISNGIRFAQIVIPALTHFAGALAKVGAQKGAVDGIAGLIAGIANGLGNLVTALGPYVGGLSSLFSTLGSAVSDLGGPIGQVLGSLASALAPLLKALLPGFKALADALGNGLSNALKGITPVMGPLGNAISQIVTAFTPLLPQIGTIAGLFAQQLAPLIVALTPSIVQLAQGIGQQLAQQAGVLTGMLVQLLPQIVNLAIKLTPLIELVVQAALKFMGWYTVIVDHVGPAVLGLWQKVIEPAFKGMSSAVRGFYNDVIKPLWNDWIKPAFDGIKRGADDVVSGLGRAWGKLESVFKVPVNFLIKTVYDGGIARLWNDVVGAVDLGSLKLPVIPGLARGGVLPGYAPGVDSVPALLSPGEAVLTPGATRAIGGAPVVNALNSAHAPSGGKGGPGRFSIGGIVSGFLSGGADVAKAIAALATGNTTAFVNALAPSIGTSAAGGLGQVMVAMPKTLLTDAAKAAIGMMGGGSSSGGGGNLTAQVASWFTTAARDAAAPVSWISDLETIARHESSLNPSAVNNWDSNAAAGNNSRGIMQLVPGTFAEYHVPGTSDNIFDPIANIAAGIGYIRSRYGTPGSVPGIVSLAQGGKYVGYDSGGALPPGMTVAVNQTGQPEAILNPQQMQWLQQAAEHGSSGKQAPVINLTFTGPQMPSQEQLAEMHRQLSLLMG
jgi:phage-related protein